MTKKNLFQGQCDGAKYNVQLTRHELQALGTVLNKVPRKGIFLTSATKKIKHVLKYSKEDHKYWLERGRCVLQKGVRSEDV